ncbi:MAG: hypothetical protein HRT54_13935 [Colwellia sp.]|nr:hypothetical protein [Colwellia sp.]
MFDIHGDWRIEVYGDVIVQWFSGCWNEEAIIAYVTEFQTKATPLKGKKWAIISSFEDWELGVPEIDKHIAEHCEWFKINGCIKDCHIYTPNAVKEMQLERLIPHTDAFYERQVFTNNEAATTWLASCGFYIDTQNINKMTEK